MIFFDEIPARADKETTDERYLGRARQIAHGDAGVLDQAEAGVEISQRVDIAAVERHARGCAFAHHHPGYVVVGVDAEVFQHLAGHRIIGRAQIGDADLLAAQILIALDRRVGFDRDVPFVGVAVFIHAADRRQFTLGKKRQRHRWADHAELDVAAVERDEGRAQRAQGQALKLEALPVGEAQRLADHHVHEGDVEQLEADAETDLAQIGRQRAGWAERGQRASGQARQDQIAAIQTHAVLPFVFNFFSDQPSGWCGAQTSGWPSERQCRRYPAGSARRIPSTRWSRSEL